MAGGFSPCWFPPNNSETIRALNSVGGISNFWISSHSLTKENCHNSWNSNDINTKLEPVTKFHKRNKTTSKTLAMTSCQQIVTSLSFFWFVANLEQSGCRIPDAQSSLGLTFYFTKTENRTKKSLTELSRCWFE